MATRAGDLVSAPARAMLDTNVLLTATDEGRPEHYQALAVFNEWPAQGTVLYLSGQILREYLAVATRPVDLNGLGLSQDAALANMRAFREQTSSLTEDNKVTDQLLGLLAKVACSGKQVHDANVVATMLVHGIDTIVTANVSDFARFGDKVKLIDLRGTTH